MRNIRAHGLAAIGLIALAGLLQAATPVFWTVSTRDEFLRGDVDNLTIDDAGQLELGPIAEVVADTTSPFVWTTASVDATLWIASGHDGRVFTLREGGDLQDAFDANELNIHALHPVNGDQAFVGSSPNGKVYRISAASSESSVVFDPDESYIWALAQPPGSRDLFVATGEPGRIYRVTPSGDAEVFYETETAHVLALAFDATGTLWAGTASPGRIFRITPDGRGFVALDSAFREIRSLRVDREGVVYAVGVNDSPAQGSGSAPGAAPAPSSAPGPTAATTSTGVTAVVSVSTSFQAPSAPAPPPPSGPTRGAVFRIAPDGVWDVVWGSATEAPYDVLPHELDGETGLLVATGREGKIFRVSTEPRRETLLAQLPVSHVTRLVEAPDGSVFAATANPGKVYRVSASRASAGRYVSEVRDTSTVSTWGTIRWRAMTPPGTRVRLQTRSGNTAEPSATWSPWSEPYDTADGSPITSPKARYVQWRAELSGERASPRVLSVTTAYLPRNIRPEITDLTVHDPGVAFQQPFSGTDPPVAGLGVQDGARGTTNASSETTSSSTLGRRIYRKGLQTFVWTARDENGDELEFDLWFRREGEPQWRPLLSRSRDSVFAWDTTTIPDGTYRVRLLASDAMSNAPGAALTGFVDSTPFDIDNTAPQVTIGTARREASATVVPFVVEDTFSPIARMELSVDPDRWQLVYPLDGIPDSRIERFEVSVPTDSVDRLVLRATDALGNVTTVSGR